MEKKNTTEVKETAAAETPERKKKGCSACLIGCAALAVAFAVLAVLGVIGYRRRHHIFLYAVDRFDIEAETVLSRVGTGVTEGVPPEFAERSYEVEVPGAQQPVIIGSLDTALDQAYNRYIEYYESEGWVVSEEHDSLKGVSEQVESMLEYMEQDWKAAELKKGDIRKVIAVTTYREKTIGIVWRDAALEKSRADSDVGRFETEEKNSGNNIPEKISGTDPEGIPLYPGAVRTGRRKYSDQDITYHEVSYVSEEPDKSEVVSFFESQLAEKNWSVLEKVEQAAETGLSASRDQDSVYIRVKSSKDYPGYVQIDVLARYR